MRAHRTERSDESILTNAGDVTLLRAVDAGQVVRGACGETSLFAPYMLDGEPVRLQLRWLAEQGLVEMPISGPPWLTPRADRLLSLAPPSVVSASHELLD
jgi:hypothetical protein